MAVAPEEMVRRSGVVTDANTPYNRPGAPAAYSVTAKTPAVPSARPSKSKDIAVRRPTMGLGRTKPSWATLEVLLQDRDQVFELFNSCYPGGKGPGTANFILQSIQLVQRDASQVTRTFGNWHLSDTGIDPSVLEVQGVLLETPSFPYMREWIANWTHYISARRCIINNAVAHLTADSVTYEGYILSSTLQRSHNPSFDLVLVSFQMVLRSVVDQLEGATRPGALSSSDLRRIPVIEFYQNSSEIFGGDPNAATLAQNAFLAELERPGDLQDNVSLVSSLLPVEDAALIDAGTERTVIQALQIPRLVALAQHINTTAGYEIYNLQDVARGLQDASDRSLEYRHQPNPYGEASLATYREAQRAWVERQTDRLLEKSPETVTAAFQKFW